MRFDMLPYNDSFILPSFRGVYHILLQSLFCLS